MQEWLQAACTELYIHLPRINQYCPCTRAITLAIWHGRGRTLNFLVRPFPVIRQTRLKIEIIETLLQIRENKLILILFNFNGRWRGVNSRRFKSYIHFCSFVLKDSFSCSNRLIFLSLVTMCFITQSLRQSSM